MHRSLQSATPFFHVRRIPAAPPRPIRRVGHSGRPYEGNPQEIFSGGPGPPTSRRSRAVAKRTPSANQVTPLRGKVLAARAAAGSTACHKARPAPAGNDDSKIGSGDVHPSRLVNLCVPDITARRTCGEPARASKHRIVDTNPLAKQNPAAVRRSHPPTAARRRRPESPCAPPASAPAPPPRPGA